MNGQIPGCVGSLQVQYVEIHHLDDHEDSHTLQALHIRQQGNFYF